MDRALRKQLKIELIFDRILDLVDDESIPIDELEAKVTWLKAKADKLESENIT